MQTTPPCSSSSRRLSRRLAMQVLKRGFATTVAELSNLIALPRAHSPHVRCSSGDTISYTPQGRAYNRFNPSLGQTMNAALLSIIYGQAIQPPAEAPTPLQVCHGLAVCADILMSRHRCASCASLHFPCLSCCVLPAPCVQDLFACQLATCLSGLIGLQSQH